MVIELEDLGISSKQIIGKAAPCQDYNVDDVIIGVLFDVICFVFVDIRTDKRIERNANKVGFIGFKVSTT